MEALAQSIAERVIGLVVGAVDVNAVVDEVDLNAVLDRVDVNALLAHMDLDAIVNRIDVDALPPSAPGALKFLLPPKILRSIRK